MHSYLILAYADRDKVAMNVGFYYMANAVGRLAGTILSGLLYQWQGLKPVFGSRPRSSSSRGCSRSSFPGSIHDSAGAARRCRRAGADVSVSVERPFRATREPEQAVVLQ